MLSRSLAIRACSSLAVNASLSRALATSNVKVSSRRCCSGIISCRRWVGSTITSPSVLLALRSGNIR
ncbi:hypothetical protein D3C80_1368340 [compost metagenome]